jgi:site-specific DNA recombinase
MEIMKRAIGLVRVSTTEQKEIGYGIPEQVEKIAEHISRHGYQLAEDTGFATEGIEYQPGFFQEDYTGKTVLRPAIAALQEAISKHHIEVAVIHRTSRLGRRGSVQEVLEASLQAQGVRVEYVNAQYDTANPYGRAMRRIAGIFDELDYENIICQLAEGKAQAVKQGSVMVVRPPYGYECVKIRGTSRKSMTILSTIDEEVEIVQMIYTWYVYGDEDGIPLSIHAITKKLSDKHIPTRWDTSIGKNGEKGLQRKKHAVGNWSAFTVSTILKSETYIGRWAYRKHINVSIPGTDKTRIVAQPKENWLWVDIPAIIDRETYDAAQARIAHNKVMEKRNKRYNYLFSGNSSGGYPD